MTRTQSWEFWSSPQLRLYRKYLISFGFWKKLRSRKNGKFYALACTTPQANRIYTLVSLCNRTIETQPLQMHAHLTPPRSAFARRPGAPPQDLKTSRPQDLSIACVRPLILIASRETVRATQANTCEGSAARFAFNVPTAALKTNCGPAQRTLLHRRTGCLSPKLQEVPWPQR